MANDKKKVEQEAPEESDSGIQSISLFLAIGLIIGALLIGMVIGYMVPKSGTATDVTGTNSAPALSPNQVQSGQLPPGHPQIPAGSASSTDTTGAPSSTGNTAPSGTATGTSGN